MSVLEDKDTIREVMAAYCHALDSAVDEVEGDARQAAPRRFAQVLDVDGLVDAHGGCSDSCRACWL
jgi:hypothetical protein